MALFEANKYLNNLGGDRLRTKPHDWDRIVNMYHSDLVTDLSTKINSGEPCRYRCNSTPIQEWMCDEIKWEVSLIYNTIYMDDVEADTPRQAARRFDWIEKFYQKEVFHVMSDLCDCTSDPSYIFQIGQDADNECSLYACEHYRAYILSHMWAWYHLNKYNCRAMKTYYLRLQRVILSLPLQYLRQFSVTLITDPYLMVASGKNLLQDLFKEGFFFDEIMPKEQGGCIPSQSQVDTTNIFTEELMECAKEAFGTHPPAKEQGLFTVEHKLNDESMEKLKGMINESHQNFNKSLGKTIVLSSKTVMVMFATAASAAIISSYILNFGFQLVMKLLHTIYEYAFPQSTAYVRKSERIVQQGGEIDELSLPFLPAMFVNYVIKPPKKILSNLWSNPEVDRTMRKISYLGDPKVERGLDRILTWIKRVFEKTQAWFYEEILGWPVPEDISSENHAIKAWHEEIDDVVKHYYAGTLTWTDTTWSLLHNLYSRGLTFTRSPAFAKWRVDVWKHVNSIGNILEKFKNHARDSQTIRNPPVTIYMTGGTGVGKSSITYPLAGEMLRHIFSVENSPVDLAKYWKSFIYMRAAEQEFWDGYEDQMVTVFDDFCQITDSAANPNLELFEIIRAANCFPYPLHMAAVEQKANTTFTSKIVLVSSNLTKPKTQSLNFPDALARRFDVSVKVTRKPEFKDYEGEFRPDIFNFEQYDMVTGKHIKYLTYQELIALCVDCYFKRRNFVDSIDEYMQKVMSTPVPAAKQQGAEFRPYEETVSEQALKEMTAWREMHPRGVEQSHVPNYWSPMNFGGFLFKQMCDAGAFVGRKTAEATYVCGRKVKSYFSPVQYYVDESKEKLFGYLKVQVAAFKMNYGILQVAWNEFKREHPYLFRVTQILGYLILALSFLGMFQGIKARFAPKDEKYVTEEGFVKKFAKSTKAERDARAEEKSVTEESYSAVLPKTAKVESYTPQQPKTAKVESTVVVPQVLPEIPQSVSSVAKEEGVKDLNAAEMLNVAAKKNLYKMFESTFDVAIGHVFFLRGRVCVMPKHFVVALRQAVKNDPDATVYFKGVFLSRGFEAKISEMLETKRDYESPDETMGPVPSKDYCAMVVKEAIVHPDVTKFFCERSALSRVDRTEVMIPVLASNTASKSDRDVLVIRYREARSSLSRVHSLPITNDKEQVIRWIREAWKYSADTQVTECGAPVFVRNTKVTDGKICGFHVAGIVDSGEGFATTFYREDAEKVLGMFDKSETTEQIIRTPLLEYPREQGQVPPDAEFIRLGAIEKPVPQPSKTKVRPSLVYGRIVEPKTKPCLLRPRGEFDPRGYRLGRLGNITKAIDSDIIENAQKALTDELSSVISAQSEVFNNNIKPYYTFEEAVCGIDGEPFVNAIKRDTSPGFPYVQIPGMTKRTDFFGTAEKYDLSNSKVDFLRMNCSTIENCARENVSVDNIFIDTLKDERKPVHKAHKTRLFSAGALDYLIVTKQYFNGIVALLEKTRNYCHISVGTNPYSLDWTVIARVLQAKSQCMVAGDFEGFDASQHQKLLRAAGEVMIELSKRHLGTTDEQALVMRVLLVACINSIHLTGREVYQWTHSLPSGHYLTAPINSLFVNLSFGCIWQLCFSNRTYSFARKFWDECGIVAYGDDHIVSIPPERISLFNQMTMPKLFSEIGLSYTMEDKDAVATQEYRSLGEISYLKRGFLYDKETGFWVAPLDLSVVLETPMWIRDCPDERLQTIENLEFAVRELSLHGEDTWNEWFPCLNRLMVELNHYTVFCNRDEVRRQVIDLV